MRRGDICVVDLDPSRQGEPNKRGPAVVVSNDGANRTAERLGRGVLTVVPITSNVSRIYPFHVLLPSGECGLHTDSKAQAEQMRAVSVSRVGPRVGQVPTGLMGVLDQALRLHLAL